jgi:anaerobic selenocysteine-containing dehydrogenase
VAVGFAGDVAVAKRTPVGCLRVVIGKAGIGTPHMDGNTRLCRATSAAAQKASFGTDGQPASYGDVDHCDALALWGHNVAETQTVLRNWNNADHIRQLAELWNVDEATIPHWAEPTHAMQIFRYAEQGSIKLLWISATNPAISLPALSRVRRIWRRMTCSWWCRTCS